MKFLAAVLFFLVCTSPSIQGQGRIDNFIDKQLKYKNVVAMNLPGWLVRKAGRIGQNYADGNDESEFLKLTQYIKNLRFLVLEEPSPGVQSEAKRLLIEIESEGYERYVNLRSQHDHVHIMVKKENDIIKNMLVFVNETHKLVLVNLKMSLALSVFDQLNFDPKYNQL